MSKFAKALEQAQRDRALRLRPAEVDNGHGPESRPAPAPPTSRPTVAPRRPAAPAGLVDDHLVSLVAPASLEAEQYRALRHRVEQRHKADGLTVVAITSPGGGDGKTTTAINLAGALAQDRNARVLLVEADLRRPSIASVLGFSDVGAPGFVHAVLERGLTLADVVQPLPAYNLNVVLAGQTPPSPYEVLRSPRLGELIAEARRDYDYVVMDTSPLVPVQDCRVIARWIDGIILVVAAHHTPRPMLEAALEMIEPAQMVGVVFNGYDHLLADRYHGGYYAPGPNGRGATGRKSGALGRMLGRPDGGPIKSARRRSRNR